MQRMRVKKNQSIESTSCINTVQNQKCIQYAQIMKKCRFQQQIYVDFCDNIILKWHPC